MNTSRHIILTFIFSFLSYLLINAQTVNLSGTLTSSGTEAMVRSGGGTIILTLSGGTWAANMGADNDTTRALINGFTGNIDWADVTSLLDYTDVELTSTTVVTITLPAVAAYDIFSDETVDVTIDLRCIEGAVSDISAGSFSISHDPVSVNITGTVSDGTSDTESQVRAGSSTIILTVQNDTWQSTLGNNNALTTALLDGITGNQNWSVVRSALNHNHVARTSATVMTISIPTVSGYFIPENETVTVSVPASSFNGSSSQIAAGTFTILNQDPVITITGTIQNGTKNKETDIRAGGSTILLTISGDQWVSNLGTDGTVTDALLSGLSAGIGSEWDTKVIPATGTAHVTRNSPSLVTISLPAVPSYNIASNEIITADIPASVMANTSAGNFTASPNLTITPVAITVAVSGNITSGLYNKEDSIRHGGGTIVLTLSEAFWASGLGDDDPSTEALINGISGSSSWNSSVRSAILGSDRGASRVEVSGQVVTVNLPPVPSYNILTSDAVSISVPASAMQGAVSAVNASPGLNIIPAIPVASLSGPALAENNINGAVLTIDLKDETFENSTLLTTNFTLNGPAQITLNNVNWVNSTQASLTLAFSGDIDVNSSISFTINQNELTGSSNLTTNSLSITALVEPVITAVTIPAGIYGIGQTVRVDITVVNDQGKVYSYGGGQIGGKAIQSLTRQTSSLYYGFFTVNEGDTDFKNTSIPVSSLRLDDGAVQGENYSGSINGTSVVIDAHRPVISAFQAPGSLRKIGDIADLIVLADQSGYTLVPGQTRVNGVFATNPRVYLQDLGSGIYQLKYLIEAGDPDVVPGALTAQITLRDAAGNTSTPHNTLSSNTISIDANAPVISSLTVQDKTCTTGDTVRITILADGSGYSVLNETAVNGISMSSGFLSFAALGGNQYRLEYRIRASDPEVEPGELQASVILKDASGNSSLAYTVLQPNNLAIYTLKPTATIIGNQQICEGDSARLTLNLTGRTPYMVYLKSGGSQFSLGPLSASTYEFYRKPASSAIFTIDSVVDRNGIGNTGSGSATVTVNLKTPVNIINLNTSYSKENDPVKLQANVPGGIFTGPGVISSTGFFNPSIADTTGSPHTILYTYTNAQGCVSTASKLVYVLSASGTISISKTVYCNYDNPFVATANNSAGSTGTFKLLNSSDIPVSGLADNLNNTATIQPRSLAQGSYTILYEYLDGGANLQLREPFSIESVPEPRIITPTESVFCKYNNLFRLEGDNPAAVFAGPGVSGNTSTGFNFNPAQAPVGESQISFTFTTSNGCFSRSFKTVQVDSVPNAGFTPSDICVGASNAISFINTTVGKSLVSSWNWNFGDINSGPDNISALESPSHVFSNSGPRTISLIATTSAGCRDTLRSNIDFGEKPRVSFTWINECFLPGDSTRFVGSILDRNNSPIPGSVYKWTFYRSPADSVVKNYSGTNAYFAFPGENEYTVKLTGSTNLGCIQTETKILPLKPTITIAEMGYYEEDFESGNGNWSSSQTQLSQRNSWDYRLTPFSTPGVANSKAWFTSLPGSPVKEQSYVISPCFNLKGLPRPMIKLDIFRSLERNREGAVLQYSLDNGNTWQNIGTFNDSINWYNSFQVNNKPGEQDIAWTGFQPFRSDPKWIEARHDLNAVSQSGNVRLRIAFASDHNSILTEREGFGFDNIWIGSRSRKVLSELFVNNNSSGSRTATQTMDNLYEKNSKDLLKLEYHTDFPGTDLFNTHNRQVPATRVLFYGVTQVPYMYMDGGADGLKFDFSGPSVPTENHIFYRSLKDPSFELSIEPEFGSNSVTGQVKVKALRDMPAEERILQLAVYEREISGVTAPNGMASFRNIVKAMLPNAAGTAFFNAWTEGEEKTISFTWNYNNVYDPEMIRLAAFLQSDETKEVFQAATTDTADHATWRTFEKVEGNEVILYPNPARETLNLKFPEPVENQTRMLIYDQTGRMIRIETLEPGTLQFSMDLTGLSQGVYIVRFDRKTGSWKFVITGLR